MERPHPLSRKNPQLAPTQDLRPFYLEERPRPIHRQPTVSSSPVNKPTSVRNIAKNVLAGAALHVAASIAGHALPTQQEHTQEARQELLQDERSYVIRNRVESLDRATHRYEEIQRARRELVERSRQELLEKRFDFARFLLATNRLDALEDENRSINTEEADRKIDQTVQRFQEYMRVKYQNEQSPENVLYSLYYAIKGYEYRGVDGLTLADGVLEGGGPCTFAANFLPAVLWRAGIHEVGQRIYAAPEGKRFGHRAGILLVGSGADTREIDLVSWGDPYRDDEGRLQGLYASVPDLVEWYAAGNGIQPRFNRASFGTLAYGGYDEEGEASASDARFRANLAFATSSGLRDGHFFFSSLPPTRGNSFPDISPATSNGLMGVYLSRGGRIYSRPERENRDVFSEALTSVRWSMEDLIRLGMGESIGERLDRRNVSGWGELSSEIIEGSSMYVDVIDQALQHAQNPVEAVILSASSLAYWNILQEAWTREGHPRTAQHAERMAGKRFQEVSTLLARISEEEVFRFMNDLSAQHHSVGRREGFCVAVTTLVLNHEHGWPLLLAVTRRAFDDRTESHRWSHRRNTLIHWLRALANTNHSENDQDIWALMQKLNISERVSVYRMIHREMIPNHRSSIMAREFRMADEYVNDRTLMEMATGVAHAASGMYASETYDPSKPRIPFYQPESGTFIQQRPPRWSSFLEFKQDIEGLVHEQDLDVAWVDFLIGSSIRCFAFWCDRSRNPTSELQPVERILMQAVPWIESHHASLIARDFMTEYVYGEMMQRIRDIRARP